MNEELSIIFPALNERVRLIPTLNDYYSVFGDSVEYIVVDNGSTDGTKEAVVQQFPHVTYIRSEVPLGKGGAVYEGFNHATSDIIGFTDPDGATVAVEFTKLLAKMEECDMAIGSRWLPLSQILPRQSILRQINSRLFNLFVRAFLSLPFTDTQCGAKVIKKSVYEKVKAHLTQKEFSFDVDLIHKVLRAGHTVCEVPIVWKHVEGGSTFKPFRSGIRAVRDVWQLRHG